MGGRWEGAEEEGDEREEENGSKMEVGGGEREGWRFEGVRAEWCEEGRGEKGEGRGAVSGRTEEGRWWVC